MNSDDSLEADISDEEEDAQQKPIQDDDPMEAVEDENDPFERFIDNSCFPSNKIAIVFFFMLVSLHGRYLTDEGLKTMMMYINMVLDIYGQTNYRFPKYARPDLMDNAVEIEDQQPSVKKEEVDLCWEAGEQTTDARIMAR
ncbi:hypothetical protein MUCCIDRAFT_107968 [Mucor lusitanicus CBS 277.49]|uniref:Uncharacterized protein n=1 Tax=Mucor lusitanicus CBS 277.49 TaxID=747725 RepID=A0A168LZ13_MUCCL|nr:hypothetical protein MUCCIDRAFT_107968 [Mucor lusitanicus CBS 277.49]